MITTQTIQGTDSISASRLTINANFDTIKTWINDLDANSRILAIKNNSELTLTSAIFTTLTTTSFSAKSIEVPVASVKGIVIPPKTNIVSPVNGSLGMNGSVLQVYNGSAWVNV